MSDPLVINTSTSADRTEQVKKYKERYGAMMEGIGSFSATIGNVWQNAKNGHVDLSGVSVFNENGTCATSM